MTAISMLAEPAYATGATHDSAARLSGSSVIGAMSGSTGSASVVPGKLARSPDMVAMVLHRLTDYIVLAKPLWLWVSPKYRS